MNSVVYNVQPFNEFALESCYSEAYLPAFKYFGGQEIYYLLNKFVFFWLKGDKLQVSMRLLEAQHEIEERYGVILNRYEDKRENVIQFIIDCLSNKKLVICRTLNSVSYNPDTKKKTEKGDYHWVLIFGYNVEKREFDVLEHYTPISALYYPLKMSFSMLEASYKEAFNNAPSKDTIHVVESCESHAKIYQPRVLYVNRYKKVYDEFVKSNDALISYLSYLQSCGADNITQYDVLRFSEIIKYYQRESYMLNEAGISQSITPALVKYMNLLRTYCIKCTYTPDQKNYEGIINNAIIASDKVKSLFEVISYTVREGVSYEEVLSG